MGESDAMRGAGEGSVEIRLFGGPRVRVGEREISRFSSRFCEALLTLLALEPGRRQSRDDLAEALAGRGPIGYAPLPG